MADLTKKNGDKLANYLTMVGHICSDINQGALAATLPFLVQADGYSYASVAMLVFAANIASAVIQPLFGWLGDRRPSPWLMALGIFLAGLGMAGVGVLDNYWLVVASAMLSGIGVAMFHPEGGRLANLAAGEHKGNGMSIFALGGNIGFAVGPIITAAAMAAFGTHGTLVFLVPATACAVVLLGFNRRFVSLGVAQTASVETSDQPERWGMFAAVLAVLSLRSVIGYGLTLFIPLFLVNVLGATETLGSGALTLYSLLGAVAPITSGRVSERIGSHRLLTLGLAATAAFSALFALSGSVVLALVCTGALALATSVYYASTVALGMSYVPNHLGMASGLCYGVAVAAGGVTEPFLGMLGDAIGLRPVMLALAAVALGGVALGLAFNRAAHKDKVAQAVTHIAAPAAE